MSTDADFGERLEAQTATYLDRIDDCVALLPQAFDEYASGGPYRETVDEIAASKASATTKSGRSRASSPTPARTTLAC